MPPSIAHHPGANGTPTDDSGDIGGAIQTGTTLNEATDDLLIDDVPFPTSGSDSWRGVGYSRNTGTALSNAVFINRAGAIPNASSGVADIQSTNSADTGVVKIVAKVSGAVAPESITAAGTTLVTGSSIWDTNTFRRAEYLVGGVSAVPQGTITIRINGVIVGLIYGSTSAAGGNTLCSTEFELALATAKGTTLTAADRKTDPTGISAYSRAVKWTGLDQSIAIPTGSLGNNEYIGWVPKLTLDAGYPKPVGGGAGYSVGVVYPDITPTGDP